MTKKFSSWHVTFVQAHSLSLNVLSINSIKSKQDYANGKYLSCKTDFKETCDDLIIYI